MIMCSYHRSPSSRGLGRGPFKAKTRVRIPLGTPPLVGPFRHIASSLIELARAFIVVPRHSGLQHSLSKSFHGRSHHERSGGPTPRCACHTASTLTSLASGT